MRFEEDSCHNLVLSVIDDKGSIPHPIRISSHPILNHPIYSTTVLNPSEMALFYSYWRNFIRLCLGPFCHTCGPSNIFQRAQKAPTDHEKYLLMSLKPLNAIDLILTSDPVHSEQSQRADCIALLINV